MYVVKTRIEENMKLEADEFASWGLDYIKFNYGSDFDTMHTVYQDLGRALNATGRPMVYACSWPFYHELSDSTVRNNCYYETTGNIIRCSLSIRF